jgi:hypothetical protein
MTSYSKKINGIEIDSCKKITDFYLRVSEIAKGFGTESADTTFQFCYDGKSCGTESFEEFAKQAYGKEDFELIWMRLTYFLPNKENISVSYIIDGLSASASNEALLDVFVDRLDAEFGGNNGAIEVTDNKRSGKKQKSPKSKKWSARVKDLFEEVTKEVVIKIVLSLLGIIATAVAALIAAL